MSRRRSLSEEERALWTGVARSITPLRGAPEVVEPDADGIETAETEANGDSRREAAAASPHPRARREPQPVPKKKAPPLAPLERRFKQRVARGRQPIDNRLDLHGLTQTQAHGALLRFLHGAQADGAKVVLVVTGKGRSKTEDARESGVLKRQVPLWLSLPEFRPFVVGYDEAHVGHGGQGALYVRLRRIR